MELRRAPKTNEPTVHLYYANVTNNFDIYKLKLNESRRFNGLCKSAECSLANFEQSLQSIMEVNAEQDCQVWM